MVNGPSHFVLHLVLRLGSGAGLGQALLPVAFRGSTPKCRRKAAYHERIAATTDQWFDSMALIFDMNVRSRTSRQGRGQ